MRVVIVHSREPVMDAEGEPTMAHCFGPFDSFEAALEFDQLTPDDCYKWVLDLVGPEPQDIELSNAHEALHGHDVETEVRVH